MDSKEKATVLRELFAEIKDPVLFATIRNAAGLNKVNMHAEPPKFKGMFGGPTDILRERGTLQLGTSKFSNLLIAGATRWLENNNFNPNNYTIEVKHDGVKITMKEDWTK